MDPELDRTANGRFPRDGGWLTYRADLPPGHRYVVELRDLDVADGDGLAVTLQARAQSDSAVPMYWGQGQQGVARTTVQIDTADLLLLTLTGPAGHDYAVHLWPIAADDHGDGLLDATPMQLGEPITGRIDSDGDRDCFAIDLAEQQTVRFRLDNPEAWLQLLDAQGQYLGMGRGELFFQSVWAGTYTLMLGTLPDKQGPYEVRADVIVEDHGGTFCTATPLAIGQTLGGQLDGWGDIDAFTVELQAGQRYEALLTGDDVARMNLQLVDQAGYRWPTSTAYDDAGRLVAWIDQNSGGWLELRVQGNDGRAGGPYMLSLKAIPQDDHGGTADLATALQIGQSTSGQWDSAADQDCFDLPVRAGQRLRVLLEGQDGTVPAGATLWIEGESQQQLPAWERSAAESSPVLVETWQADADTRLVVHTQSPQAAAFRLRVDVVAADDHADSAAAATPLDWGVPMPGSSQAGHDIDCFSIEARAGHRVTYRIEATGTGDWQSLLLLGLDSQGRGLGGMSGSGEALPRILVSSFTPQSDGLATLALETSGALDCAYTLTVWQDPEATYWGPLDAGWLTAQGPSLNPMGLVSSPLPPTSDTDWP